MNPPSAEAPVVASYCTTFLKPEMRHIYRQVSGLRRYRTFILTRERQCEERFPFEDVELVPRARKNFLKRFWLKYLRRLPAVHYRGELQEVLKILQRRPADLLHVYFGHTGVHLLPFIRQWDRPSVVSFHGMDIQPRPDQPGYDAQMRELLQTIPLVLARSHSLLDRLRELGAPAERLRLNRTGIPLEAFPLVDRPCPSNGAWRLVQACRLIAKKGLRTTLEAFAQWRAHWPEARLTVAGEGPLRGDLERWITELNLHDAVELRGFLTQADLNALFAESHLFLHPSETTADLNQEGVPNSMLEAMSTGLPVIATRHGGIPEAVTHEREGLLAPERDSEALAAALHRLTREADLWHSCSRAAAEKVRAEFAQAAAVERLESCYDEAREAEWRPVR